jgi:hypothetical protein
MYDMNIQNDVIGLVLRENIQLLYDHGHDRPFKEEKFIIKVWDGYSFKTRCSQGTGKINYIRIKMHCIIQLSFNWITIKLFWANNIVSFESHYIIIQIRFPELLLYRKVVFQWLHSFWWCLTFNNISVILWWSVLLLEKTTDLSQVTDKLYHLMLYTSPWSVFELTTSVVICTDGIDSCKKLTTTI